MKQELTAETEEMLEEWVERRRLDRLMLGRRERLRSMGLGTPMRALAASARPAMSTTSLKACPTSPPHQDEHHMH